MRNLLKNQKIVICLDQFCTSNMYDNNNENGHWREIKNLLLEAYDRKKIICPIPFEHFIETSQKEYNSGINTIKEFLNISGGYMFKFELFVTSQLIISFLRKNNTTLNTYLAEHNEILFLEKENYNKVKVFKNEFNTVFTNTLEFQNAIRNATRDTKKDSESNILFYKIIKKQFESSFTDRLKNLLEKGYNIIRGDKFGDKEVPNWEDLIIHRLVTVHRMTSKETEKLINHIDEFGFSCFPALDIKTSLMALGAIQHKKEQESDHIDFMRIATGMTVSDIIFTDKRRKFEIIELGLDKKYNCTVLAGIEEDLIGFKKSLNQLIEN